MNIQLFQKIAEQLLQKHYGLSINDTRLCEQDYLAVLVDGNCRPFEYINEHAKDCDLGRIDVEGGYGAPSKAMLTSNDEIAALELVSPFLTMCD